MNEVEDQFSAGKSVEIALFKAVFSLFFKIHMDRDLKQYAEIASDPKYKINNFHIWENTHARGDLLPLADQINDSLKKLFELSESPKPDQQLLVQHAGAGMMAAHAAINKLNEVTA